jgi:transposase
MDPAGILAHYRSLWQVEESFRLSKHDLRVRPIYHWTDNRIKAHVAIVFMAYCCIRYLQYRVKLQYEAISPEVLVRELNHVQTSLLVHTETGERYSMPSKLSVVAKKLYKIMEVLYQETPCRIS